MLGLFATALSLAVAAPASAAPLSLAPAREPPIPSPESTTDDPYEKALSAWSANPPNYVRARQLLEPVVDSDPLDDPLRREKVLLLLADATLLDTTINPEQRRRDLAAEHLTRLMDADPSFEFPTGLYSKQLQNLWSALREERSDQKALACQDSLTACRADVDEVKAELRNLDKKYRDLDRRYKQQQVQQVEVRTRTRALAIFPLGISHFYNRRFGLGGGFLAAEAVFGIAGLTLLIYRNTVDGCTRRSGFRPGSLECDPRGEGTSERDVVTRRRWEEAMAYGFVITAAIDIVVAQATFKPATVINRGMKTREEIENLETGDEAKPKRRRRNRRQDRKTAVRASVRPTPAVLERGAGLGFRFRF